MLDAYRDQLHQLCKAHGVRRLELFGSAARGDFDPLASDYDFFVEFAAGPVKGSFKRYMGLKFGLEALLGRPVDLVEVGAVRPRSRLRRGAARQDVGHRDERVADSVA